MLTGFIMTDTDRLAAILSCSKSKVKEAISSYIRDCDQYINWQLIDIDDELYRHSDRNDWRTFALALDDYYLGLGLEGVSYSPLFILGGDDVVPMPAIESPLNNIGREYLYSDIVYCFEAGCVDNLECFVTKKPRFAAGRLPLTKDWDLGGFSAYLSDCVKYAAEGISVRGAVMTTTQSWLRASKEMMRDIPTVVLSDKNVPLNEKMIVSPDLDTEYEDMYDGFVQELKKVDFLVCNLHGNDSKELPFFFGEDKERTINPIAMQPSMMYDGAPFIINTVACYGGRYVDYTMDESMLLSSMAYGTMLYCGSCDISFGGHDMEGNSELMMKLYNIYLNKGIPAGLALMKAKQDYFRTCHDEDGDEYAMYTILEFNLFGCPIVSMKPKLSADYRPTLLGQEIAMKSMTKYYPKTMEPVSTGAYKADNIHSYLHNLVDNNLFIIQTIIETEVYRRLGLGKDKIKQVMRVCLGKSQVGYQFLYSDTTKNGTRNLQKYYIVNTDNVGKITKIITTK